MKVDTLNNRSSMLMNSLTLKEDAILNFQSWRDVNAWHQIFRGQAEIMLGENAAGDLKLKPMLTIPKILGPLRFMLNLFHLCSVCSPTKPG